ncbi:MAG TPA: glycosyltransferase family 4 protein [Dehalococcoidia bacterium]|jgi:glycosyltransferase involved in cell wall biosynthesis|nr:glycosyltransferase family 4 protein [Dehalococcoidia bacterium]
MKICFLMYQGNMYSGGQGVYLYYLTRELARMGHEVHVIAGPPYPQLAEGVIAHEIRDYSYWTYHHYKKDFVFNRPPLSYFHPVNFYEFMSTRVALSSLLANFSVRAYFRLRELSREHRFDVVHDNQTLSYGVWAAHATGFPLVATIHHPLSYDLRNALRQARTAYERARRILWSPWIMQEVVARRLDRVIVVSETSRRDVEEAFGLDPERVRTVYNGIDTDTFRPLPGVGREAGKILYVGNSEDRNKGARYFLEALDLLKDELDFRVTFVDNERWRLKLAPRLVDQFGLNSRIDFTGRIPTAELVRHYNEAMLFVTSSVHEGFGLPLAEAMACGAPVVATDIGAYREIARHGEDAWLVPPADPRALANAIRMMWNDASLRGRIGEGGRRRILEKFNWRTAAEQTLAVYDEVMPHRRKTFAWTLPGAAGGGQRA